MRSLLTASPMTEAVRVSGRGHRPGLLELLWFAGILEFFGPFFIAVGLFTRPVAFLLSGQMAFAYLISRFHRGFWPVLNWERAAALSTCYW